MTTIGKSAKRMGKLRPRDVRKMTKSVARPPAGIPPHEYEKRRRYVLTVVETTVTVNREIHRYRNKEEREQAKAKIEREAKRWDYAQSRISKFYGEDSHSSSTREYIYSDEIADLEQS